MFSTNCWSVRLVLLTLLVNSVLVGGLHSSSTISSTESTYWTRSTGCSFWCWATTATEKVFSLRKTGIWCIRLSTTMQCISSFTFFCLIIFLFSWVFSFVFWFSEVWLARKSEYLNTSKFTLKMPSPYFYLHGHWLWKHRKNISSLKKIGKKSITVL